MSTQALDQPLSPRLPRHTIAISVAIHAVALLMLPGLAKQAEKQLPPIVATLRLPPAAQADSAAAFAAASPQKQTQPAPSSPRPVRHAEPTSAAPIAAASQTPAAAPAAAPQNVARSESVSAPTAPVAAAPAPAPVMDNVALDNYGRALSDMLARQQLYPRVAAMRGWEGEVRLRLKVARKGNLVAVQVEHSSGHDVLDQHAVQMVQGATLPSPPDSFGEREIQVVVPIHYKLQKPT